MGTAWLWFVKNNARDCHVIMHALSLIRVTQTRLVGWLVSAISYTNGTNRGTVVWGSRNLASSIDEVTTWTPRGTPEHTWICFACLPTWKVWNRSRPVDISSVTEPLPSKFRRDAHKRDASIKNHLPPSANARLRIAHSGTQGFENNGLTFKWPKFTYVQECKKSLGIYFISLDNK